MGIKLHLILMKVLILAYLFMAGCPCVSSARWKVLSEVISKVSSGFSGLYSTVKTICGLHLS